MAQKRILKRDASTGRISEGASGDTYFSADPSTSTDLTTKNYADTNLAGQPISAPGSSSGQLMIYDAGANQWVPGDPLVQGLYAEGHAIANPVTIGGKDGSGNNKAIAVDSSGNMQVVVVSGSAAGTQYADNAASGSTPTGNLMSSWDVANSKVRAVVCDANQYPKFNVAASSLTDPAEVVAGTTASTKILIVGGKTNDGTAQYRELPEGAGGRSVIIEGYTGGTAVPVSFTQAALPSHQSVNVDQLNGTTTDTNSGSKSAGTLRVVLATDQPQLTNKLLVTPDSVALPNHQSTNVDQLNGTTTDTNSGTKSAGTLRVVLATDQPALTNKLLVTPDSVALPAHQSTNVDQLNGTTTDTNSGTKSAGTLRVVLATDQPQLTNKLLVTPDANVKVNAVGNAGASLDSTVGAGTAPTNAVATSGIFSTTQPAPTNGQAVAVQIDQAANKLTFNGVALKTLSAQGTSLNSTQTIFSLSGAEAVMVQLTQTTTITAGAVTFEFTYDGSNWTACPANCVVDPTSTTFAQIAIPYTCQASTNKVFLILCNGATGLRIRTSTAITGTGSVTPNYALQNFDPLPSVIALSPTAANFLVTTTPPTHASTNVDQLNGTTTDTNSGTKSAGTLRVVLATDQPQLTNKLLVTPDSVALPNHQSTNVDQIAGTTPDTNSGNKSAGTLRVVIATDQVQLTNALKVDPSAVTSPVSLAANGTLPYSASVNATKAQVKGSAGTVFGWSIMNTTSAIAYCQVFNLASASVTVGTTTPDYVIPIPANATTGAGSNIFSEKGWSHSTGITIACTTTRTGSTNAACDVLMFYS